MKSRLKIGLMVLLTLSCLWFVLDEKTGSYIGVLWLTLTSDMMCILVSRMLIGCLETGSLTLMQDAFSHWLLGWLVPMICRWCIQLLMLNLSLNDMYLWHVLCHWHLGNTVTKLLDLDNTCTQFIQLGWSNLGGIWFGLVYIMISLALSTSFWWDLDAYLY